MDNVVDFPTPREQAGVSMLEDLDMLLDSLMGAMVGLKNSENVAEEDRTGEVEMIMDLFVKYINVRAERYPGEEIEE